MNKKVLLTATVQSHICQFHKPLVSMLHEHGYEVHVAARDNLAEKNGLKLDFVEKVYDVPFARSPKSTDNIRAYRQLKKIVDNGDYEVIHCNTPMGGIVTRLASRKARKKGSKVFYTAHGFHFYKGAPKKNWLTFYPIELFMARFCDTLITITKEDYRLAGKKFHTGIKHIHGVGVYTDRYHEVSDQEAMDMRVEEGLTSDDFVVLCTGELNKNKNQKVLIEAAGKLKKNIPNLRVLLAGNGPLEDELREKIQELNVEEHVKLLGYRTDLEKITPAVDMVVSCSHREGLPLNILEAMLCKKAVVTSKNRGHNELVLDGTTGHKVDADDVNAYVENILYLYNNEEVRKKYGENGYKKAQKYTAEAVGRELEEIYTA
ncbi:MAG: glycosyltransferase family 4 protein [Lachnospiraceae bacterium]|nr:glycosyltransferase family 4 protein [Lachnospiraceae bacterium]